jgi:hypothetical protein
LVPAISTFHGALAAPRADGVGVKFQPEDRHG